MHWECEPKPASEAAGQAQLARIEGEANQAERSRWLLLDMMAELPDELVRLLDRDGVLRLSVASRPDVPVDRAPALVPLSEDDSALSLSFSVANEEATPERLLMSKGRCVGGWVSMPRGDDAARRLRAHMQTLMFQRAPLAGPRLIRLTDGRVWTSVVAALNEDERSALMGPLLSWHVLDLDGALCGIRQEVPSRASATSRPWVPTAAQWLKLERMSVMHRCLARWRVSPRTAQLCHGAGRAQHELCELADRAVQMAISTGFSDPADLESYVLHSLWHGEAFAQRDPWLSAVSEAKAMRRPLDDVLADIEIAKTTQPLIAS